MDAAATKYLGRGTPTLVELVKAMWLSSKVVESMPVIRIYDQNETINLTNTRQQAQ